MHTGRKIFIQVFAPFLFLASGVHFADAAVRINEIAWMGTAASSTGEWIELVNDADTLVPLSGWRIEAEDGSPTIVLSGSIGANGYFLVERTNDMTVPNIPADFIAPFGTGLSNAGETLSLKNATGATVDTVVGGTNWGNIGGDNATKQTPQRMEGDKGGWVTGAPTPRAPNVHAQVINTPPKVAPNKTAAKQSSTNSVQKNSSETGTTTVLWKGNSASPGASGPLAGRNAEWFFLATGVVLALLAGLIIFRSKKEDVVSAEEYSIVEDIIESADD